MKTPLPFSEKYNELTPSENSALKKAMDSTKYFVSKSKKISKVNYATRDAHAKTYAYLKGTWKPNENDKLATNWGEGASEAWIRFSHANLVINKSDKQMPILGMAFGLRTAKGEILNYPTVNFPVFVTNSITRFLKLFKNINYLLAKPWITKPFYFINTVRHALAMLPEMGNASFLKSVGYWMKTYNHDILSRTYHGVGVYRLGNAMIKLRAVPLQAYRNSVKGISISDGIRKRLREKPLSWELQYQIAYNEDDQPINVWTRTWKNSPYNVLGTVTLNELVEDEDKTLEIMDFNPFENKDGYEPVGKIQRIRKDIYEVSIQTRNKINSKQHE